MPEEARGAVVAIGNFDGVHLGHRAVIAQAARIAHDEGRPLAVLTFEPHPREVLGHFDQPFRLTPFRIKAREIAAMGVALLFVARFDRAFAAQTPEEFVRNVLVEGLGARHLVVGYDFAFGRARAGNSALLEALAADGGYRVSQVSAAGQGGKVYSASEARDLLRDGDVAGAAGILGRWWEMSGRVRMGDRRGRQLGFPTANLAVEGMLHPGRGVYALWAGIEAQSGLSGTADWHPAVANLGRRPTFDKQEDLLEIHLLDFDGDLYGRRLRACFVERIRPERKFDGLDALKAQIAEDRERARVILAALPRPDQPAAADLKQRASS